MSKKIQAPIPTLPLTRVMILPKSVNFSGILIPYT